MIERSGISKIEETRRTTALDCVRRRAAGKADQGLPAHFCRSSIFAVDIGEVALEPDVRLVARVIVIRDHAAGWDADDALRTVGEIAPQHGNLGTGREALELQR